MLCDFARFRREIGLSQVELAALSGVSLPTIQNIEANKANPSLDVLEKLLSCFGIELRTQLQALDYSKAISLGVPLFDSNFDQDKIIPSVFLLFQESKKWSLLLSHSMLNEREEEAIVAFVYAINSHYPKFYKQKIRTKIFDEKIETFKSVGRVIKLRRIALVNLSRFL
jgi:transcriptional regulator with XRE-family HTH domain